MRLFILSVILSIVVGLFTLTPSVYAFSVVKDGNGDVVGGFLTYTREMPGTFFSGSTKDFLLISRTGYTFYLRYGWSLANNPDFFYGTNATIRAFSGLSGLTYAEKVYFETDDCSGSSYINGVQSGIVSNSILTVEQIWTDDLSVDTLYYVPKGKMPVVLMPQSHLVLGEDNNIVCQVIDMIEQQVLIEALPNDPLVTGVSQSKFPLPVYFDFDYRFGTPQIFSDRFIIAE